MEPSPTHAAIRKQMEVLDKEHRQLIDKRTTLELKNQTLSPVELGRMSEIEFELGLGEFELELRYYEEQKDLKGRPWKERADDTLRRAARLTQFRFLSNAFAVV